MLSRELGDFLVELSIAMHKHAIYPPGHPLLTSAVDAVARRMWGLLAERAALSIGVARHQLIIEGVATDPSQPLLHELAQKLHRHQIGAMKFTRGIERNEVADVLATLAVDAARMAQPLGLSLDDLAKRWQHVRAFSLTFDRLELIEEEEQAKPVDNQMRAGYAAQLWVGLARAALAADAASSDDDTPLEPVVVARAIDEHQREQAYDQVVVGYMLQIASELRVHGAAGPNPAESAALQSRISRLVEALRPETLARLLEMGGDLQQRRRFLQDATQGMNVEAVVELVKAAAIAERQTISHSMVRLLSKLAQHAGSGSEPRREAADQSLRESVLRLMSEWSLADPNPDSYRAVLETVSRTSALDEAARDREGAFLADAGPTECEPQRIVAMALETGATGAALWRAIDRLERDGKLSLVLDLLDQSPDAKVVAEVYAFFRRRSTLERLLAAGRIDFPTVERLVRRERMGAVGALLDAALEIEDAKSIEHLFGLLVSLGDGVAPLVVRRLEAISRAQSPRATVQRDLLALLGRWEKLPPRFDGRVYLRHPEPYVRREAAKLLLRDAGTRDEALVAALGDGDDRTIYLALNAACERCPREGLTLIRRRMERGELDASLSALGIRAVATLRTPDTLRWLTGFVAARSRFLGRMRLLPPTPPMLAALSAIVSGWKKDPAARPVLQLAARSREAGIRGMVSDEGSARRRG